ncbi:MAG: DUF4446 family protein [Fimbriimonas sp.]
MLVLAASVLVLAVATVRLARRQRRTNDRWRELLEGGQGETLESLLAEHLRERVRLEADVKALGDRVVRLETQLARSKRHLGMVRYDAFEEVRGNQSFAMALYDDQGNGAVLSGIVGRTDSRIYCKPLVSGRSERNLSQEEQRAIEEAVAPGVKSIVSP